MLKPRPAPSGSKQDGEGSYLASASDLMIGLLFIFIILVVVLALEQRRQEAELGAVKGAADPRASVTEVIGQALKDAKLDVRIDPASGVISLPSDTLFALGSSSLSAPAVPYRCPGTPTSGGVRDVSCRIGSARSASSCSG